MIQPQTRLKVADNSGAKEIMCFRVLGGSFRRTGSVGDVIVASVKSATPGGAVKKGELSKLFIIKFAEPVFACIFSALVIGENVLKIQYLVGFLLICFGILLSELSSGLEKTLKK